MFGLSLYSELLHGSAQRTWDCVAHVVGALWHRVVHHLGDINRMPRSRRRHHSRSRSRTNSHDRDREPKRRKVENYESPHNRRSVSSEPEANEIVENAQNDCPVENIDARSDSIPIGDAAAAAQLNDVDSVDADTSEKCDAPEADKSMVDADKSVADGDTQNSADSDESVSEEDAKMDTSLVSASELNTSASVAHTLLKDGADSKTPQKRLTPKQVQKRLESEKKKAERQREKDERQRLKQQERDEKQRLRQLEKDAKDAKAKEERDAKQREKDLKDKEREAKRREKEEKDEIKRKEREVERMKKQAELQKKQAEIEEKNREKQKLEEKKQKAAAAFTKFFVAKPATSEAKKEATPDEGVVSNYFMPFQLKSDMRLAPTTRGNLTMEEKEQLLETLLKQAVCEEYLLAVKTAKRRSGKTWPNDAPDDDVMVVESDIGEGILNSEKRGSVMKAKFLKFHENQRPAYYGTWRKKSKTISGKNPFAQDSIFNYEIDSDDEWEEEEEGEDIAGSDDEEKEPDSENDYEVDDEFFVPHGHLSDDEENDEDEAITPEMRKAKEKLLKNQFDEERKAKTLKLKPRMIGCIWYNQNNNEDGSVDTAIDQFLKPFSIIANGIVTVKKRSEFEVKERRKWRLEKELMPDLLRLLHGNAHNKKTIALEFFEYLSKKNIDVVANKMGLIKLIRSIARWGRCKQEGPLFKKMCWLVNEDTMTEFNHVALSLPNTWQYCTDISKEIES